MSIILQQLLYLYVFLCLGWLFGKLKKDLSSHTGLLSFLLVNLFLPAKVFGTFQKNFTTSYVTENYVTVLTSLGLLLLLVAVAKPVAGLLTKDPFRRKVYRYTITVSNYAYMGYVLIGELYGAFALTDLILFCIPFAFYTYTFGYTMLTGKDGSYKRLLNPLSAAILLGIVFGLLQIPVPQVLSNVLTASSACVGPISMVLTGLALSAFALRELVTDVSTYVVVALRLLVLPLAVFGAFKLICLTGWIPASALTSAVIMAAMPSGLNTIVFPKLVGEDCKPGARLAFLSHLLSVLTLPVWLMILEKGV